MAHVVLLGDSVFDNAAYVGVGPEVVQQLRSALPDPWQATRLAVAVEQWFERAGDRVGLKCILNELGRHRAARHDVQEPDVLNPN